MIIKKFKGDILELSNRVKEITDSITLQLNAAAVKMSDEGKQVYNLTAGQLPFRPPQELVNAISEELKFLKSFQYSPVPGFPEVRKKFIKNFLETRNLEGKVSDLECMISNGGKHSISNLLGGLLDEGDEVIVLAPYWLSYPEMIRVWGGKEVVVQSHIHNRFQPQMSAIAEKITSKTKGIIINSPNNPAGVHYDDQWMKDFATLLQKHHNLWVISDEIYFDLCYYDPGPTYFYQHAPELMNRTFIVDGISKNLASTGLRIGLTFGPSAIIKEVSKLQSHLASGANSLIQRALGSMDFGIIKGYLEPINKHLRDNAQYVRSKLSSCPFYKNTYQSVSAFYYILDFTGSPKWESLAASDRSLDYADHICMELLQHHGVALVPCGNFGLKNAARMSLVSEKPYLERAMELILKYLEQA